MRKDDWRFKEKGEVTQDLCLHSQMAWFFVKQLRQLKSVSVPFSKVFFVTEPLEFRS